MEKSLAQPASILTLVPDLYLKIFQALLDDYKVHKPMKGFETQDITKMLIVRDRRVRRKGCKRDLKTEVSVQEIL